MILTKELLHQHGACEDGINFCERNKLFGFDLDRLDEVAGDYNGFVVWVTRIPKYIYVHVNSNNQIIQMEDTSGFWVNYEYDSNGNRIREKNSHHTTFSYEYDERGNKITINMAIGMWKDDSDCTKFEYDSNGNRTKEEKSYGSWVIYEYDSNNNKIRQEDNCGHIVTYEYDSKGNMILAHNSYMHVFESKYDECNNIIESSFNGTVTYHDVEYYDNGQLKRYDHLYIPLI
jgi:YD repeat-containing protein